MLAGIAVRREPRLNANVFCDFRDMKDESRAPINRRWCVPHRAGEDEFGRSPHVSGRGRSRIFSTFPVGPASESRL